MSGDEEQEEEPHGCILCELLSLAAQFEQVAKLLLEVELTRMVRSDKSRVKNAGIACLLFGGCNPIKEAKTPWVRSLLFEKTSLRIVARIWCENHMDGDRMKQKGHFLLKTHPDPLCWGVPGHDARVLKAWNLYLLDRVKKQKGEAEVGACFALLHCF